MPTRQQLNPRLHPPTSPQTPAQSLQLQARLSQMATQPRPPRLRPKY